MHEIDFSNNQENMAYVGEKPWHGLGQNLPMNTDIDTWKIMAGLNWEAIEAPIQYVDPTTQETHGFPERKVLLRSDTRTPLSIVGSGYKAVQPGDILEFYRDLVKDAGFRLETAGSLKGGRRVWALARTGMDFNLYNVDLVKGYLLLATSYDGTMATVASYTSVRVVCWNTLQIAVGDKGQRSDIRIHHGLDFVSSSIKDQLGLGSSGWNEFADNAKELSKRRVSREEAVKYFLDLVAPPKEGEELDASALDITSTRVKAMFDTYQNSIGQNLITTENTAWGLVNAVTRFYDHERSSRTPDNRLDSAWFGEGRNMKNKAWESALELLG